MTILKKARHAGRWASLAAGAALVSILAAAPAAADPVNDIIHSLAPIAGQPKPDRVKPYKSVPYYGDPSGPPGPSGPGPYDASNPPPTITVDYDHAYELVVYFPFDSAELTDYARNQLYALGTALRSPALLPYRYLIAGHTDATGLPEYNRDLSIRRAYSVTRHLVERYGIDPRRLLNTGWGATQLKDPRNPRSGINRRVEVALVVDPDAPAPPPAVSGPDPYVNPPPPRGTYSDAPPPPPRGTYDAPPPPRRGTYSDAPPPPRRGTYSDAPPPPPRGTYSDAPPPPAPGPQPVVEQPAPPTPPPAATPCSPAQVRDNVARGLDEFAGCEGLKVQPGGRIIINSQ